MGGGVFTHLDADPAPAHLVGDGGCGAGAEEAVEDEVTGVGGDIQDALKQSFWLWGFESIVCPKKLVDFFF